VFLGRPRFASAALQTLADREGLAAAWAAALPAPDDPTTAMAAVAAVGGDFAVGIHWADGRAFLAVDRFAIRSVCLRLVGKRLHFAARADELAAIEPRAPLDPQALYEYLYFHAIPSPLTVFEGVVRLPPAHCAYFDGHTLRIEPYWTPRFEADSRRGFEDRRAEFMQLLQQSVAAQLDGSTPACFLSGGTDSSTVAGMIGRAAGQAPASYSIGFEAEGYDEMQYARLAARHFGTRHHELYVTPADVLRGMPMVAAHHDQPFGNSSAVPAYFCAEMARADGVTRLLAGDGGDELFGGNSRYAKQRLFGLYDDVPAVLRRHLMEPLLMGPAGKLPLLRKGASYVEQARVPMPDRLEMYNLLLRIGAPQVLQPGFLSNVDAAAPLRRQQDTWRHAQASNELDRNLAFDWRYTLADTDLPKVCGSTALAGVGVGFPLLDDRLLAFSMRLPQHYKLKGLRLRWFFKEALRGFLPDEIISKRKHGFGLPFGVWALGHPQLRALADDTLASLVQRGLVRGDFVQRLRTELLPAHPGYYGEMVWILAMLELWLRAHRPDTRFA
jgi:asparagine synthase (glutamine-hydrolysing)